MTGPLLIQNKPQQISKMKKFKILLSLITVTILLTSCGLMSNIYSDEKYGDWTAVDTE